MEALLYLFTGNTYLGRLWAKDTEKRDWKPCPQGVPSLLQCAKGHDGSGMHRRALSLYRTRGHGGPSELWHWAYALQSLVSRLPPPTSHPHPPHPPTSLLTLLTNFTDAFFKVQKQTSALWVSVIAYSKLVEFELMRFKKVVFLLIVKWVWALPMRPLE